MTTIEPTRCFCGAYAEENSPWCPDCRERLDVEREMGRDNIDSDYDAPSRESEWRRKL